MIKVAERQAEKIEIDYWSNPELVERRILRGYKPVGTVPVKNASGQILIRKVIYR